jgi:hypothetical protein
MLPSIIMTGKQMDIFSELLQSLSQEEVNRLKNLKKDAKMVCIKNLYSERKNFDSFEDYYDYYTGERFHYKIGEKYNLIMFYSPVSVNISMSNLAGAGTPFRIFKETGEEESMKYSYLFEYFMFEHEWESLNREEQISTVLD